MEIDREQHKEMTEAAEEALKHPGELTIEESEEEEDDDVQFIQKTFDPKVASKKQDVTTQHVSR